MEDENNSVWQLTLEAEKIDYIKLKETLEMSLSNFSNQINWPLPNISANSQKLLDLLSSDKKKETILKDIDDLLNSTDVDINAQQGVTKISPLRQISQDRDKKSNNFGYITNPLLSAILNGHSSAVILLLKKGAILPDTYAYYGITPLRLAIAMNQFDVVDYLLKDPKHKPLDNNYSIRAVDLAEFSELEEKIKQPEINTIYVLKKYDGCDCYYMNSEKVIKLIEIKKEVTNNFSDFLDFSKNLSFPSNEYDTGT